MGVERAKLSLALWKFSRHSRLFFFCLKTNVEKNRRKCPWTHTCKRNTMKRTFFGDLVSHWEGQGATRGGHISPPPQPPSLVRKEMEHHVGSEPTNQNQWSRFNNGRPVSNQLPTPGGQGLSQENRQLCGSSQHFSLAWHSKNWFLPLSFRIVDSTGSMITQVNDSSHSWLIEFVQARENGFVE